MTFVSRSGWGARPPAGSRNALDPKPLGSGVHWNGPGCAASLRTHDKCAPFLRGIQNFHMGPQRGWSDIAYSVFVCPHGDVFEGRGKNVGTAAFGTNHGNRYYYAIYAMWGQGDGPAPAAMLDGIAEAVALCRSWGAGSQVIGHRDENKGTECPGDELYRLVHAGRFSRATTPKAPSAKPTSKPKPATSSKAPAFPLPRGHYFGPKSGPASSVSGYYGHRADLKRWQQQMRKRGWPLTADGLYGSATAKIARAFQKEKGLPVDGLIGAATWAAAWNSPVS